MRFGSKRRWSTLAVSAAAIATTAGTMTLAVSAASAARRTAGGARTAAMTACYLAGRRGNRIARNAAAASIGSGAGRSPRTLHSASSSSSASASDSASDSASSSSSSSSARPLFSFGLLADIQYAPIPDGFSFGGAPRYYRHSLDVARHAAQHFEDSKVDMVVSLGDIVDGKCQDVVRYGGDLLEDEGVAVGERCVDHVLDALSVYRNGRILHSYGNHCLYNLSREDLQRKLGMAFVRETASDELVGYSSWDMAEHGVRFVMLDTYDIALMQRDPSSDKHRQAREVLRKHNPNYALGNENSPQGMHGLNKRFVAFNGGVDVPQLQWLRRTLQDARANNEKVVVLSHQPILPGSSGEVCLVWNYEDVLEVLRDYRDVVVASLSGHAHKGGYKRDEQSGIHFRVVEAALESYPAMTYAIVDFYDGHMSVRGFGDCESALYDFDHLAATECWTTSADTVEKAA